MPLKISPHKGLHFKITKLRPVIVNPRYSLNPKHLRNISSLKDLRGIDKAYFYYQIHFGKLINELSSFKNSQLNQFLSVKKHLLFTIYFITKYPDVKLIKLFKSIEEFAQFLQKNPEDKYKQIRFIKIFNKLEYLNKRNISEKIYGFDRDKGKTIKPIIINYLTHAFDFIKLISFANENLKKLNATIATKQLPFEEIEPGNDDIAIKIIRDFSSNSKFIDEIIANEHGPRKTKLISIIIPIINNLNAIAKHPHALMLMPLELIAELEGKKDQKTDLLICLNPTMKESKNNFYYNLIRIFDLLGKSETDFERIKKSLIQEVLLPLKQSKEEKIFYQSFDDFIKIIINLANNGKELLEQPEEEEQKLWSVFKNILSKYKDASVSPIKNNQQQFTLILNKIFNISKYEILDLNLLNFMLEKISINQYLYEASAAAIDIFTKIIPIWDRFKIPYKNSDIFTKIKFSQIYDELLKSFTRSPSYPTSIKDCFENFTKKFNEDKIFEVPQLKEQPKNQLLKQAIIKSSYLFLLSRKSPIQKKQEPDPLIIAQAHKEAEDFIRKLNEKLCIKNSPS